MRKISHEKHKMPQLQKCTLTRIPDSSEKVFFQNCAYLLLILSVLSVHHLPAAEACKLKF